MIPALTRDTIGDYTPTDLLGAFEFFAARYVAE